MKEIKGRNKVWKLDFDLATGTRISNEISEFDLFGMQEKPDKLQELRSNPFKMADFLVVALDGQFDAEDKEGKKDELSKDFNAAAIHEARTAITEEFINFIPEERRNATLSLLETATEVESDLLTAMAEGIKEGDIKAKAKKRVLEGVNKL